MKFALQILLLNMLITPSWAALSVDQPFAYSDTAAFHANSDGWYFDANAGGESLTQLQITSGSLQKSGIASGTGNKLTASGNFEAAGVLFANSSDIFASAMLRFDTVGRMDTNGTLLMYLGERNIGSALGVHARLNGTNVQIGISKSSGWEGGVVWNSGSSYTFGETIFFVLNYTTVGGTNNDIARAWIYGASQIDPAWGSTNPSSSTLSLSSGFTDLSPNQFNLHWNYSHSPTQTLPNYSLDAVRVGNSFSSVTPAPEPSTISLLLLSSVAIGTFLYRKRKIQRS